MRVGSLMECVGLVRSTIRVLRTRIPPDYLYDVVSIQSNHFVGCTLSVCKKIFIVSCSRGRPCRFGAYADERGQGGL
jgi:hypothetical protein